MLNKDLPLARLRQVLQRLKSLILSHLEPTARAVTKATLAQLDEMYTNNTISIDEYKQKSLALLLQHWDANRREQFLYREATKLLTDAEIFQLLEFLQKTRE